MHPETKNTLAQAAKWLTIASSGLTALAAGLAVLPIDSVNLPTPPNWRPYLAGAGIISLAIARVVVPFLDTIIKGIQSENPPNP